MSRLLITGGHILTPVEERFCDLLVDDGRISALQDTAPAAANYQTIDASGCWITPGLIDLQVNGGKDCDFWGDPVLSELNSFAQELCRHGVTTILPTLITDDLDHLRKNIQFFEQQVGVGVQQLQEVSDKTTVRQAAGQVAVKLPPQLPVRMPGIHLEGPCLSPERPGVHPKQYLQPLNTSVLSRIVTPAVKLMTLAPELDPGTEALSFLRSQSVTVALGHSNATFEEAEKAFSQGIALVTHTFNAMPPLHHRALGAAGAALLDPRVSCCIICDGLHLSPGAAKLVFKLKGAAKTILVTDMAHVGTNQGGLVGSSIMLNEAVGNVVRWGICSFQDAIMMATFNPAKAMGWDNAIGHLAPGKLADIVIWDRRTLSIKHVILRGELLH
jgi:N-acetylglucosamine-6-phosphate deacetylase